MKFFNLLLKNLLFCLLLITSTQALALKAPWAQPIMQIPVLDMQNLILEQISTQEDMENFHFENAEEYERDTPFHQIALQNAYAHRYRKFVAWGEYYLQLGALDLAADAQMQATRALWRLLNLFREGQEAERSHTETTLIFFCDQTVTNALNHARNLSVFLNTFEAIQIARNAYQQVADYITEVQVEYQLEANEEILKECYEQLNFLNNLLIRNQEALRQQYSINALLLAAFASMQISDLLVIL